MDITRKRNMSITKLLCISVSILIFIAFMFYCVSYVFLSRRGISEVGGDGFYYVTNSYVNTNYVDAMKLHRRRKKYYEPINWLDRKLFDGQLPADGGIRELIPGKENSLEKGKGVEGNKKYFEP